MKPLDFLPLSESVPKPLYSKKTEKKQAAGESRWGKLEKAPDCDIKGITGGQP